MQRRQIAASLVHKSKRIGIILSLLLLVGLLPACTGAESVNEAVNEAVQATLDAREATELEVAQRVSQTVEASINVGGSGGDPQGELLPPPVTGSGDVPSPGIVLTSVAEEVEGQIAEEIAAVFERIELLQDAVNTLDFRISEGGGGGGDGDPEEGEFVSAQIYISANSEVNVRNGPGTNYGIISSLNPGEKADVLGKSNDGWYNIQLLNERGWISTEFADFVDADMKEASVPFSATVPPAPTPTRKFPTTTPTPTNTPSATSTPTATPTATPGSTTTVIVVNASSSMVCQLLIHPSTAPSDDNRLGLDPLVVGGQISIELGEGATIYDFEARSCADDSVIASQDGVEIFENLIWTINDSSATEE